MIQLLHNVFVDMTYYNYEMIKCSRFLVLISFTEHLEYFGHLEQSILAISRMCKLRKILNHDRLSSLKFIVRDISATIFHYKMFATLYFQVQPNIKHGILVGFLCGFKTMENKFKTE